MHRRLTECDCSCDTYDDNNNDSSQNSECINTNILPYHNNRHVENFIDTILICNDDERQRKIE